MHSIDNINNHKRNSSEMKDKSKKRKRLTVNSNTHQERLPSLHHLMLPSPPLKPQYIPESHYHHHISLPPPPTSILHHYYTNSKEPLYRPNEEYHYPQPSLPLFEPLESIQTTDEQILDDASLFFFGAKYCYCYYNQAPPPSLLPSPSTSSSSCSSTYSYKKQRDFVLYESPDLSHHQHHSTNKRKLIPDLNEYRRH